MLKLDYYSAEYFRKTRLIVKRFLPNNTVVLQFFQRRNESILCGIKQVLKLLSENTNTANYTIRYLPEGSHISAREVVLELEGPYQLFGHFEGIIDGILTRMTSLATNAYHLTLASQGKEIIAMTDRADHYLNQKWDGYAFAIGGIKKFTTPASLAFNNGTLIGTMPHALIQMFNGDLVKATKYFIKTFPTENLVALVDFNNDVINDSLLVAKTFPDQLKMVRVDTSDGVSDKYFLNNEEDGVTPNLIKALRKSLDKNGFNDIKIIVSSSFDIKKIQWFITEKAPVDCFGVGKALLKITNHFTCDAVKINGKKIAKSGRSYQVNHRLVLFK